MLIDLQEIEGVTVVSLANGKVNALDLEMCQAITATFQEIAAGPHQGVVFTGAGRSFSAGVDLWRIIDGGPDYVSEYLPALVAAFQAVFTCDKPLVTAVNGHAIAGGCVLASSGDHRIMSTGIGSIGIPEVLVGVPFPAVALELMSFAVGAPRARAAVFSGQLYRPQEALDLGFVDELSDPDTLLNYAVSHAARLATTIPPDTFRATKNQMRQGVIGQLNGGIDTEVVRIWQERAADGWIRDYMNRTVRR